MTYSYALIVRAFIPADKVHCWSCNSDYFKNKSLKSAVVFVAGVVIVDHRLVIIFQCVLPYGMVKCYFYMDSFG